MAPTSSGRQRENGRADERTRQPPQEGAISFTARKELATELACPPELMSDSAKMNTWRHKTVLARIAGRFLHHAVFRALGGFPHGPGTQPSAPRAD